MDTPSPYLHHHATRYAPPPPPSQPLHPSFSAHTFLPHHHQSNPLAPPSQQFLPPPPLLPSHQPLPPPPPPPSFNHPQDSRLPFNPSRHYTLTNRHHLIPDAYRPSFDQSPRILPSPPSYNEDRPRRLPEFHETRLGFRDFPDNWQHAEMPYRRQLELAGNSRFLENKHSQRDEILLLDHVDDHSHCRRGSSGPFGSNNHRSCNDLQSLDLHLENYESSHHRRGLPYDVHNDGIDVSENHRWVHDREVLKERELRSGSEDPFPEIGGNEVVVTRRRNAEHYRIRDGTGGEFERHGSKAGGSREGSYEFNRTPRKQIPKKSAFLRIQKPVKYRNREDEKGHFMDYLDDSKSSSFRGNKDHTYLDHGMMGEEVTRVGSPVELDVSFKSNSLVAKAIMTPSSSAGISDTNSTPPNSKIRKVLFSNKDSVNCLMSKASDGTPNWGNSVNLAEKASSSDTVLKQSKENVAGSGLHNMCYSSGTRIPVDKEVAGSSSKGTVSDKSGNNATSGKTSSPKTAKKRKIITRVVKKVVNTSLNSSSSLPTKVCDEHTQRDSVSSALPAAPDNNLDTRDGNAESQPFVNEANVLPENKGDLGSQKAITSGKVGTSAKTGDSCVFNINRKRSRSPPLDFSSSKETESQGSLLNGDTIKHLHAISDIENDFTKSLDETSISKIGTFEDTGKKIPQDGDPFLLESNAARGSLEMFLSPEDDTGFGSSTSENCLCQEGLLTSCSTTLTFDKSLNNSLEEITASDFCTSVDGCKQPCTTLGPNSTVPGLSSDILCPLNFGAIQLQNVAIYSGSSNHGFRNILQSDNSCANLEVNCSKLGDYNCKQKSPDRVTKSRDEFSIEGSIGDGEEDAPDSKKTDNNVEALQLDSVVSDRELKSSNMVGSAYWVDTTLRLSFKKPSPVDGSNDASLQIRTTGLDEFQHRSSADVSETKVSVSSSFIVDPDWSFLHNNKRKTSPQLEVSVPIASDKHEEPIISGSSTSSVEVPFKSGSGPTQPEDECFLSESGVGKIVTADSVIGGSSHQKYSPSKIGCEKTVHATPLMVGISHQNDSMDLEPVVGSKLDVLTIDGGTANCQKPSELQPMDLDERSCSTNVTDDTHHGLGDDLPSMTNNPSPIEYGNAVSTTNHSEVMGLGADASYHVGTPETWIHGLGTSLNQMPIEKVSGVEMKVCGDDKAFVRSFEGGPLSSAFASPSQNAVDIVKSNHAVKGRHSYCGKTPTLPSQNFKNIACTLKPTNVGMQGKKSQSSHTGSRAYPGCSSFAFAASKGAALSNHVSKPRTWRRTDNSSSSPLRGNKAVLSTIHTKAQLPKKVTESQGMSYIRKGNSLVRKPKAVAAISQGPCGLSAVYRLNAAPTNELEKNTVSDIGVDVIDPISSDRKKGASMSFERPRTPPLSAVPKVPNRSELLHNGSYEILFDPLKSTRSGDVPKSSGNELQFSEAPLSQTHQNNNIESSSGQDGGTSASSNAKTVTYVKRKSNQLVATSNPYASCIPNVLNAVTSDGYYKRRKNQLVRTSQESKAKQVSMPNESASPEGHCALNVISSRNLSKRRSRKAVSKTCKSSKSSLVWTLHGAHISNNDGDSPHSQKVLPHLFPWKRVTYWRCFLSNSAAKSNSNSSSTIRKLLLSRNRDTIYTRSKHGFSLRMSKVLSLGGSSLKWSKSIERHSRKANEEATLAVAAAERKRREQRGDTRVVSGVKSRNSSREPVFRIGSVRYKMDSSRRTLQRILDDECPSSSLETAKDGKKSYIPWRLVIGKDEYVRIGNGNQLIRDPKKRTRILASEKVRWSLHTARSRLARKRKYCQFFTRFGKCNKDGGKCPYIHDSSKIAVCTKFLNGLCTNPDCKLTHQVIPERMPDCSYFLQGLCANKDCPYRHVHVNPSASTCEVFLRGYCAEGNECRKKHSYVCPIFEERGSCPQGSKCKLHHPKNRSMERKGMRLQEKNAQGRYFGSMHMNLLKPRITVSEKQFVLDSEISFQGGITDYVSLDVIGGEEKENKTSFVEPAALSDGNYLDVQIDELDELIKPIRIMNS